jgi:hypothetical protein
MFGQKPKAGRQERLALKERERNFLADAEPRRASTHTQLNAQAPEYLPILYSTGPHDIYAAGPPEMNRQG